MKKFNTTPISGTMELLPTEQASFNELKSGLEQAFHSHGFQSIETPTIDRTEILLAKAGGDTEKQIYKVVKTSETADEADQALRFDHTVPLARYIVEHNSDLAFPFKVAQIGRNFRGERAQKGRFREFYQCDIDVIGRENLPIAYDAEVIRTLMDALQVLPFTKLVVRVSNRKILSGLLEELGLEKHSEDIFSIVDHAEKVSAEKTLEHLKNLELNDEQVKKLQDFMKISGPRNEVIEKLQSLGVQNETFRAGVTELDTVLAGLPNQGDITVIGDMLIVRGLDYYTGTVFETFAPDHREFGSVCSGGRYENLASNFTEQKFPGVGGSIGLTRLFSLFKDNNLVNASRQKNVDICLIPFSEAEFEATEGLAQTLRQTGKVIDVVYTDKKLGDKLAYAAKIASFAAVIGENEIQSHSFELKNLETGEKTTINM